MALPIEAALPELLATLRQNPCAVLVAPPGAGKTTRVPLALLGEDWLQGKRIVMLEPRRLAARAAAGYMAALLGEQVGQTVGYRVKHDTRVGPATRIEVVTEGVLTRMLQADPALLDVGAVLFDEFHERSIHADLGLALCRQSQMLLREELRLVVMSATLEAEPVAALLDGAPIIRSEGRTFPVATVYADPPAGSERIELAVVRTIRRALAAHPGNALVFLPGAAEIRKVERLLGELRRTGGGAGAGATERVGAEAGPGEPIDIAPLYGSLPQEAQDRALAPGKPGVRKIVLATSIAETSLTVEGVSIVVDSGLMRVPRFSPRTGMTRLDTVPVAQASADQRRGRAGRLGPGVCYRLWTEAEHRRLAPSRTPEIREADLAPLALELAAWGAEPGELLWLDPPPEAAYAQARALLTQLGALGADGGLTPHGRELAGLGLHPRLAHMLVQARAQGLGATACELAALLSERDLLRGEARRDADLRARLTALRAAARPGAQPDGGLDLAAARKVLAEAKSWQQALGIRADGGRADDCGALLLYAYPDRIAMLRADGRFLLSNGRGAVLADKQGLSAERFLVCATLDDHGADSRIELAAPIAEDELQRHAAALLSEERDVRWDAASESVKARRRVKLGALTLLDVPLAAPGAEEVAAALLTGVRASGLALLPWSRAARQLQERVVFLHRLDASWPDMRDEALLAALEDWLLPHLSGCRNRGDLQRLSLPSLLEELLPWEQRRKLGDWAPTHIQVPSGSRIPVDYSDPEAPALSVRLQEMFGLQQTPKIAGGRMLLTIHLLSPAQRPVQVTRDLASFWRNAYFEVKKDLKGRYPKHYWPDDPLIAQPTSRAKPRV